MKEQKSFNDLINELNKVVKEYGYTRIKSITLNIGNGDTVSFNTETIN